VDRHEVVIADGDAKVRTWIREAVAGVVTLEEVATGSAALELLAAGRGRILLVGKQLADMTGTELLARAPARLTFLVADENGTCADTDREIRYRLVRGMSTERVRALLMQAASTLPAPPPREADAAHAVLLAPHAERIATHAEPADVAVSIVESVRILLDADRAHCLFCDEATGAIWSATDESAHEGHASEGLVGFAMRSGVGITVPCAGEDPMFHAAIDDPSGDCRERLAVQPVVGADGHTHAVMVAVRSHGREPFDARDLARLEALAHAISMHLVKLELRLEAEEILGETLDRGPSDVFRHEAVLAMLRRGSQGDIVCVHPAWVTAAYWIVVLSVAGAFLFAALAHVHQYTDGPAIVRYRGRTNVVAYEAGTVTKLGVTRGERVKAGQVLVRLNDGENAGRFRALDAEFEHRLVAYLQSPAAPTVREALARVVSERESALAGVESRLVRAPRDGVVRELVVHPGRFVEPGTALLSLADSDAAETLSVIAFLPGHERPRLHTGQNLRLTVPGYRGARITSEVRAISSEVLGANEARARYLGGRPGDSLPIEGTVVVVEAHLSSPSFESEGQQLQLHDGMVGIAEVQLGAHSVLETLLPGLQ
jgi:HlyD family secretion protein/GAF domain/Biotin-lipoyl like